MKIINKKIILIYVRTNVANFDKYMDNILAGQGKIALIGVFNATHVAWSNPNNNTRGRSLMNYDVRNNLEVVAPAEHTKISNVPEYTDSTIDIAQIKNMNINVETINDLISDQLPVNEKIRSLNAILIPNRKFWEFQSKLQDRVRINRDLDTKQKIDEAIVEITENIQRTTEKCIPKLEMRNNNLP